MAPRRGDEGLERRAAENLPEARLDLGPNRSRWTITRQLAVAGGAIHEVQRALDRLDDIQQADARDQCRL